MESVSFFVTAGRIWVSAYGGWNILRTGLTELGCGSAISLCSMSLTNGVSDFLIGVSLNILKASRFSD
jgi:hypothetical protein